MVGQSSRNHAASFPGEREAHSARVCLLGATGLGFPEGHSFRKSVNERPKAHLMRTHLKAQGCKTGFWFVKQGLSVRDTRHFRHFRAFFRGLRSKALAFVDRVSILVIFAFFGNSPCFR